MCNKCEHRTHQTGYTCPCECHHPMDRTIVERNKRLTGDSSNG